MQKDGSPGEEDRAHACVFGAAITRAAACPPVVPNQSRPFRARSPRLVTRMHMRALWTKADTSVRRPGDFEPATPGGGRIGLPPASRDHDRNNARENEDFQT
jgi:hypothetical protein